MNIDPRFSVAVDEVDGQKRLCVTAAADVVIAEAAPRLCTLSYGELLEYAGAADPRAFQDRKALMVIEFGWQSWSFGGEVPVDEPRRIAFRAVDLLTRAYIRPAARLSKSAFLSHFVMGLRSGDSFILIASRGDPGPSGRGSAPLSFRLHRRDLSLDIEALAEGARYAAGEAVAEVRILSREGFFGAKDALRSIYADYRAFDRLSFLGHKAPGGRGDSLVPGGYESWYNHYTKIDEGLILADLESLASGPNLINEYYVSRNKPTVFQVDDGWERSVGDWEADPAKFPAGMKAMAERIEAKGYIPGLWLAPFIAQNGSAVVREHPEWVLRSRGGKPVVGGYNNGWDGDYYALDVSNRAFDDYIEAVFERAVEDWGYRYLKLDFLFAGLMRGKRSGGGAAFEHYERVIRRITSRVRDRRGRPVAWLGCGAPFEASFRHFPLMRIGADTKEAWDWDLLRRLGMEGRPSAWINLQHTIGKTILDGTVFVNDPDVVFCREKGMLYGERERELIALVDFLFASQIMFSDDTHEGVSESEKAFTRRVVSLYDRLDGREYGARRLASDVFEVESRDGGVRGVVNLTGSGYGMPAASFGGEAVVEHVSRVGGRIVFEPRSISLYEV